jgi:hypothetical protein
MIRILLAAPLLIFATSAHADPRTEPYAHKDGRFSAKFPGSPKELTQTVKSPIGELKVFTATFATSDSNVFMVSYTDFPEAATKPDNRATLFDGVREGLKGMDGKVLAEKDVEIGPNKWPGREFEIEKGKQRLKYKVILRDNRLYQVAAIGTAGFVMGKETAAFFESFELTK